MWWITTTPPNGPGPRGRAKYASIWCPPCPGMVMVSAIFASYIYVLFLCGCAGPLQFHLPALLSFPRGAHMLGAVAPRLLGYHLRPGAEPTPPGERSEERRVGQES